LSAGGFGSLGGQMSFVVNVERKVTEYNPNATSVLVFQTS
jgi:hypothetical protein